MDRSLIMEKNYQNQNQRQEKRPYFNVKTKSGIMPNQAKMDFEISTADVRRFLQSEIDSIVAGVNAKEGRHVLDDIEVRVYTTVAGKYFTPLVVCLPLDVLANKKNKNAGSPIFNVNSDERNVRLKPEFYELFARYCFNKEDEKAFYSTEWRRRAGVSSSQVSSSLKSSRVPRVINAGGSKKDKVEMVTFIIDPLRIFHDMLTIDESNVPFKVNIEKWNKVANAQYVYQIVREESTKGLKKNGREWNH